MFIGIGTIIVIVIIVLVVMMLRRHWARPQPPRDGRDPATPAPDRWHRSA